MKKAIFPVTILFLLFMTLLAASCSFNKNILIVVEHNEPLRAEDNKTLLAGAAKVDITPPPGMPMSGFSLYSGNSIGVRTKLFARVFYIKPAQGRPVALVQCDLLSGSLILHHRVAELIAKETDIDAGGLLIAGTHTHSGPGNYFGNMFYNQMASNHSGFDSRCYEFLSRRIAGAIINAYKDRRPAKIATGTTTVKGVAWNRSLAAYHKNKNISGLQTKPGKFEAVNPYLHMIRVDCLDGKGSYKPLGAFTNFSLHPNTNPVELGCVYNGDIFAYSERELEREIERQYTPPWAPVHGIANYTHGDNNPDYPQDAVETFRDLQKKGNIIAEKALALFLSLESELDADVTVRYRAKEIDVFLENAVDGIKIADRPVVGMAATAGAQGRGRPSFLYKVPFFAPGWPRWIFTGGEQGHKRLVGGPLQYLVLPKNKFPHHLFLQAIQINDTVLLPLPFEVTYEMGERIASYAEAQGKKAGIVLPCTFVVTGVSNGYWGYLNTPEEYSLQYYEGGSNLYGPNTGSFIAHHLGHMVASMATKGSSTAIADRLEFKMKAKSFYPKKLVAKGDRSAVNPPEYQENNEGEGPYWQYKWYDVPIHLINFHEKLIMIEASKDGQDWEPLEAMGFPIDDSGYDIEIIYTGRVSKENMGLYEARWYNSKNNKDRMFRFVVLPRKGQDIFYSPAFN